MKLSEYHEQALSTAKYPKEHGLSYCALGLCGEAGEVAEKLKKLIRDDFCSLNEQRRVLILKELGDVLWYVASLSHELGSDLEEVAQMNIEKLASRLQRNQIKGEGDER